MKTETNEFFKVARKQQKERAGYAKLDAWTNHAKAGKVNKARVKTRDESKLF